MTDRTDIACIIAEWWKSKQKEDITTLEDYLDAKTPAKPVELIDSEIVVEHHIRVADLPNKVETEKTRIYLRNGRTRTLLKVIKGKINGSKVAKAVKQERSCTTCYYESYYLDSIETDAIGREIKYKRRECNNAQAQDFYDRTVHIKMSAKEIKPAVNCPYWKEKLNSE